MVLACGALAACARSEPEPSVASVTVAQTETARFLIAVEAQHRQASGRLGLDRLLALADQTAAHGLSAAELAAVRRDLYGHAARIALELQAHAEAHALIQKGLALEGNDPFRVQLHVLAADLSVAQANDEAKADALSAARAALDALK
jgi:hypothetical protein